MIDRERLLEARVGVFVFAGLLILAALIFAIGRQRGLFEAQVTLRTAFANIGGLKIGASVRLAGLNVGNVTGITIPGDLRERNVLVEFEVSAKVLDRIRKDSIASIGSMGLLGDKVIEVSIGSAEAGPVKPGEMLRSSAPPDYFAFLEKGHTILENLAAISDLVKSSLAELSTPEVKENVSGVVRSLGNILKGIERGSGLFGALIYNPEYPHKFLSALSEISQAAASIRKAAADAEEIMRAVREQDGAAHALIYDRSGTELLEGAKRSFEQAAALLEGIRERPSLLHSLIYSDETGDILKDLSKAAEDAREIFAGIKEGKGTAGALIADPSLYEDLRRVVGNIKRSKVLTTLLRYALEKEEPGQ